jgi:prepilin-type N-terminal cleavage/methylation domain-containing protein
MNMKRKGFTLVELLVVIGILGILSAFIYPAIRRAMIKGKITQTKTNIMSLATAIKGYYNDFNAYPDFYNQSEPDATDVGEPETANDLVMRLLTGRYWDGSNWKEDAKITTSKKWVGGPYIDLNETEVYKTGDNLAQKGNGFDDGYSTITGRAAYVDGWKNGGKETYFIFKFPNPQDSTTKALPLFNRDGFDIYSVGPDGKGMYLSISPYTTDKYKAEEVNKDNVNNWGN